MYPQVPNSGANCDNGWPNGITSGFTELSNAACASSTMLTASAAFDFKKSNIRRLRWAAGSPPGETNFAQVQQAADGPMQAQQHHERDHEDHIAFQLVKESPRQLRVDLAQHPGNRHAAGVGDDRDG